jgi:hypothetical protein
MINLDGMFGRPWSILSAFMGGGEGFFSSHGEGAVEDFSALREVVKDLSALRGRWSIEGWEPLVYGKLSRSFNMSSGVCQGCPIHLSVQICHGRNFEYCIEIFKWFWSLITSRTKTHRYWVCKWQCFHRQDDREYPAILNDYSDFFQMIYRYRLNFTQKPSQIPMSRK